MRRALFHSDLILDVLLKRHPYWALSASVLDTATRRDVTAYLLGSTVPWIHHALAHQIGATATRQLLLTLMQPLEVAPLSESILSEALRSSILDFDDAVVIFTAMQLQVDVIVTRQVDRYQHSLVQIIPPEDWLAQLDASTLSN